MSSINLVTYNSAGAVYDNTIFNSADDGFESWIYYEASDLGATFYVSFVEDGPTRSVIRISHSEIDNWKTSDRWVRIYRPDGTQAAQGKVAKDGGTKENNFTDSAWSPVWTKTHSSYSQTMSWKIVWYKDSSYSTVDRTWTFHAIGTITPKWSYSISYDANGGSSTPARQTKWYGEALTLASAISRAAVTVTYNGNGGGNPSASVLPYSFVNWKFSANQATYAGGSSLAAGVNAGGTMTAQWNRATYTTLPSATRQNHTFTGWYTSASGGTLAGNVGASYYVSKTQTLYAHWSQEYATPQLSLDRWYRCDRDGNAEDEGTYAAAECTFKIWNTAGTNEVSAFSAEINGYSVALDSSGLSALNATLVDSGYWRTGSCKVFVNALLESDSSYKMTVTMTDTHGNRPTGINYSSDTAVEFRTLSPAFYAIDLLGTDKYLYNLTTDSMPDRSKTYLKKLPGGTYSPVDQADYPNVACSSPRILDPGEYLVLQFGLEEWLQSGQCYCLQMWDVDVAHPGKNAADVGVAVYYCGGSVRLGGWYGNGQGDNNFTNGHADHLVMYFTPSTSSGAVRYPSQTHQYAQGDNDLSHSSVANASGPYINVYNSPLFVSDSNMRLTVGRWTLEKVSANGDPGLSYWEPSLFDSSEVSSGHFNLLYGDLLKPAKWTIQKPDNTKISAQENDYYTKIVFPETKSGWEIISSPAVYVSPAMTYRVSFDYSVDKVYTTMNGGDGYFGLQVCSAAPTNTSSSSAATVHGHYGFPTSITTDRRAEFTFTPTGTAVYFVLNGGNIADDQYNLSFGFGRLKMEPVGGDPESNGVWANPVNKYEANGPKPGQGIAFGGASRSGGFDVFYKSFNRIAPNGTVSTVPGQGLASWTCLEGDYHRDSTGHRMGYAEFAIDANDTFYRSFAITRQMSIAPSDTSTAAIYLGVRSDGSTYFNTNAHMKVLWSGAWYMLANQTVNLALGVSDQFSGIVLAWSAYSNSTAYNYDWAYTYIPKEHVVRHAGAGVVTVMATQGFGTVGQKYVYVGNNTITGNANNTASGTANGITYNSSYWVLRYVYGV